jgi:hypothetical protein
VNEVWQEGEGGVPDSEAGVASEEGPYDFDICLFRPSPQPSPRSAGARESFLGRSQLNKQDLQGLQFGSELLG